MGFTDSEPHPHPSTNDAMKNSSHRTPGTFALITLALIIGAFVQAATALNRSRAADEVGRLLEIGDYLPKVAVDRLPGFDGEAGGPLYITELTPGGCVLIAFYHSQCPGCRTIAPEWRGMDVLTRDGQTIPIIWIAVEQADTGAAEFLASHELSGSYVIRSDRDLRKLGVDHVPLFYLATGFGVLVRKPIYFTSAIQNLP